MKLKKQEEDKTLDTLVQEYAPRSVDEASNFRIMVSNRILQKKIGFLEKYLPSEVDRAVITHQREMIEHHASETIAIHKIVSGFQKSAMEAALQNLLLNGAGRTSADAKANFAKYRVELSQSLDALTSEFLSLVEIKEKRIASTQNAHAKERQSNSLLQEIDSYFDMVDEFVMDFKSMADDICEKV